MRIWLRIGVLTAYVLAPLAQALHVAHEAEHAVCVSCAAESQGRSGAAIRCAGGCGETGHHHHAPAHRHGECAICKASFSGVVMAACAASIASGEAMAAASSSDTAPRAEPSARSHRPRSPPVPC